MDIYLLVFSYLVETDDFEKVVQVCKKWQELANRTSIWKHVKMTLDKGEINWHNFQRMKHGSKPEAKTDIFGQISKGTEGVCSKVRCRSTDTILAVKRARVFPNGEGVAYYVLRELAVLQDMSHPHINELFKANLAFDKLHIFFPYVQRTLQDVLMDNNSSNSTDLPPIEQKTPLSDFQVKMLLHQLLDATAYCHRRGVYHRNLKPKHLLIDIPADGNLDKAQLKVADFALVRSSGLPIRTYTAKVVTLWYRAPEILMGVTEYSHAVDIWSVGCVFAEMVLGRPLFTGSSEIDQLFQLFSTLGTPKEANWPGFTSLPNYGFAFPKWHGKPIERIVPTLDDSGRDLLQNLLRYNAAVRVSAEDALHHPYFRGPISLTTTVTALDGSVSEVQEERTLTPAIEMVDNASVPSYGHHVFYLHRYLRDAESRFVAS
jgi:serine/threonine protein kinase